MAPVGLNLAGTSNLSGYKSRKHSLFQVVQEREASSDIMT